MTIKERSQQSDWKKAFWPATCKPEVPQIQGLFRKTKDCNVFHFMLLPAKSDEKILENVKKNSIFGPFCAEFQKKLIKRFRGKLVTDVQINGSANARTKMNSQDLPCQGSNKNLVD